MHERAISPSISTVQAPQMPCSQPMCVPVSSSCSRRKSARCVRGVTSASTGVPLTVSAMRGHAGQRLLRSRRQRGDAHVQLIGVCRRAGLHRDGLRIARHGGRASS